MLAWAHAKRRIGRRTPLTGRSGRLDAGCDGMVGALPQLAHLSAEDAWPALPIVMVTVLAIFAIGTVVGACIRRRRSGEWTH